MSDIFISYAKQDRTRAKEVATRLEQEGWSVFWDRSIPIGTTWDEVLDHELSSMKVMVVLWSQASVASKWVRIEAEEGDSRNILVPVLLEEAKIPIRFRALQAADISDWIASQPDTTGMSQLLEAIARIGHLLHQNEVTTEKGKQIGGKVITKEEERIRFEASEKQKREVKERLRVEAEKIRKEEEERLKIEAEKKRKKGVDERLKREVENQKKQEQERLAIEAEKQRKKEEVERLNVETESQKKEDEKQPERIKEKQDEGLKKVKKSLFIGIGVVAILLLILFIWQPWKSNTTQFEQQLRDDAATLFIRGNYKMDQKDYSGAISDFTKAIELDPEDAATYLFRGSAKNFLNDKTGACKDWEIALAKGEGGAGFYLEKYCK